MQMVKTIRHFKKFKKLSINGQTTTFDAKQNAIIEPPIWVH